MIGQACLLVSFIIINFEAVVKTQYNMMPYQQPVNFLRSGMTYEEPNMVNVVPESPAAIASPMYNYPSPMMLSAPFAPLYAPGYSYFEPVAHNHPPVSKLHKVLKKEEISSVESDSQDYEDDGEGYRKKNVVMMLKGKNGYKVLVNPRSKDVKSYKGLTRYMDKKIVEFDKVLKKSFKIKS